MTVTNTKVKDANQRMHTKQSTHAMFTLWGSDYHTMPGHVITGRAATRYVTTLSAAFAVAFRLGVERCGMRQPFTLVRSEHILLFELSRRKQCIPSPQRLVRVDDGS